MLPSIGIVILAGSIALFWWLLPTEGKISRWATMPVLESALPLTVVGGIAIGISLMLTILIG
jgi:uncharacterized membrane protein